MTSMVTSVRRLSYNRSIGLLLIRLALGLLFFTHGLAKVEGLSQTAAMFAHLGFFPWVGYFIAWLEVLGGLALIVGFATRLFAFLFGIEMLVATLIVGFGRGIGVEFVLCLVSFALMFLGSGRFSIYRLEHKDSHKWIAQDTFVVVE
jgi:putative oxidoreductase